MTTIMQTRSMRLAALVIAATTALAPRSAWADGPGPLQLTGQRLARAAARDAGAPPSAVVSSVRARLSAEARATADAQSSSGLSGSGMSRGKKWAIGLGLALAFGAAVYAIDQGVEDNTPSSRGLR